MLRVQLRFETIRSIMGSDELSVILLTDLSRQRALSVVCDEHVTRQILLRLHARQQCENLLPEALVKMLDDHYQMMVYGLHNGQYQVVLSNSSFKRNARLRFGDAVWLNIVAGYPLYMEQSLFLHQSLPFEEESGQLAIPINTMDMERLNRLLQKAIDDENYELASKVRDEIKRRNENDR